MALPPPPPEAVNGSSDKRKTTTMLTPADTNVNVAATTPAAVTTAPQPMKDAALVAAWRRFLDYDRTSTQQKDRNIKIREVVIFLYFLTASGAVLTAMFNNTNQLDPRLINVMRLTLVVMPLISVGLNTYASQFASSTSWIEYRVGAETIREKIYLYRQRAGEFANMPNLQDRQRKLLELTNEADRRIDKANATQPYMMPLAMELKPGFSVQERVRLKTDTPYTVPNVRYDDGFTSIPVDDYLDFRIRNQVDWYTHRIENDYASIKRARLVALIIAGAGSVIAALGNGLEGLVVITTAAGVALNMKADSRMYGATYATYHLTASRLRNELNEWDILTKEQQSDVANGANFVARMEKILSDERETWHSSAIEIQNSTDRAVTSRIHTDGNPIAVEAGKGNSLADYPLLQSNVAETSNTPLVDASGELLDADTGQPAVQNPA